MRKFSQAEFESEAKKLVASYYGANEKHVFMVWFNNVGPNAKAMLSSDLDCRYFEVTYFGGAGEYVVGEAGEHVVGVYDLVDCKFHEEEL